MDKLSKWEEVDAQALSMNITLNIQARSDCSSSKDAWDGLLRQYAQADPIVKNLAQTCLYSKTLWRMEQKPYPDIWLSLKGSEKHVAD